MKIPSEGKSHRRSASIHAAREGGDMLCLLLVKRQHIFQSTPPVKAATFPTLHTLCGVGEFQSTPPVKAATMWRSADRTIHPISNHAAREGGDVLSCFVPLGFAISIHAAREGGDVAFSSAPINTVPHFNPRRP